MGVAAAAVASAALVLLAAKAHGRQVRLERELEGHHEVSFVERPNHAFVEALWRRDRRTYWSVLPAAAALAVGLGAWRAAPWPWLAVATFLWAPVVAFAASGLASAARYRRALAARGADAPPWARAARRASVGWWAAVAGGAAVVAVLALL